MPLFPLYRFMQMTDNVFFFYPPDLHSNVNHILVIHSPPHASQPIHVISSLPSCHALSYSHSSTLFHSTLKFTFSINPFHHRSRLIPAFTNSRLYDGFCFLFFFKFPFISLVRYVATIRALVFIHTKFID